MNPVLGDTKQEGTDVLMLFRMMHNFKNAHIFHLMFLNCN